MIYATLAVEFFKIGLFAIGGGLVTVPFLFDLAGKYGWFSVSDLADMIAVSESTPGPLGVNMATYVGYDVAGIGGGIAATLGLVMPSIIIIILLSRFLKKFSCDLRVQDVLRGIRPADLALILTAGLEVGKMAVGNWKQAGIFVVFFAAIHYWKKSPILYIVSAAVLGVALKL